MKQLFIRFFDNKLNGVPTDSHVICSQCASEENTKKMIEAYSFEVAEWMKNHPDGKVDFVWLS